MKSGRPAALLVQEAKFGEHRRQVANRRPIAKGFVLPGCQCVEGLS
jgi:hypothetical protein